MAFDAKIKLVVDKSSRTSLKKEIDETLKSINGNVVIKSFDSSKAAAKLKTDIEQKLNGISIDVKINQKIGNKNSTAGIMSSLKSQIKSLEQSHTKLLNSGINNDKTKKLRTSYEQIYNTIENINKSQNVGTEEQKKKVQQIDKEVLAYNRKTNAVIESAKREKAAAEESLKTKKKIEELQKKEDERARLSQQKVDERTSQNQQRTTLREKREAVAQSPDNKVFQQEINNLDKAYRTLRNYSSKNPINGNEYNAAVNKYKGLLKSVNDVKSKINEEGVDYFKGDGKNTISDITEEIRAYENEVIRITQTGKAAENAAKVKSQAATQETLSLKREISLLDQMSKYYEKNSKLQGTSIGNKLQGMIGEIENSVISGKKLSTNELNKYTSLFAQLKMSARQAGLEGKTMSERFRDGLEKFGGWSVVTTVLTKVVHVIKDVTNNVVELDSAMTELKKVTDLTDNTYSQFMNTAAQQAKEVGATVSDTINATADFARLGYTLDESTQLSKAALVYKNVGDGIDDISEASESIISTMKAFDVEADKSMSIIDKFNEVGNNYAISSEGVGVALQKSAAALAEGGNSLDESIGLATGMNSVVQNPEVVGTALKSLSMYLRAAKVEAEDAGESTEDMANSVSELRSDILALTNQKVDIMADDTTFKSTYQIVKELSKEWDNITDIDKATILKEIGGKRNANAVSALITNFKDAEKAATTAAESSGSALKENEKYLDSIQGKMDQLKATFEDLSRKALSSDFIKGIVDSGSSLLNILDKITETIGGLPAVATAAMVAIQAMSKNSVGELNNQFRNLITLRYEYAHEAA